MFPLGSVLLPHMPLPLRIFEERYLVMLGRMLDLAPPEFGVVLIERGREVGGSDRRSGIGTVARVVQVTPRADDITLITVGADRFEVDAWLDDDPHPRARVRILPPLEWHERLAPLRVHAEDVVRRALSLATEYGDVPWSPGIELSDDPIESCWQLAGISPLGAMDQLRLLRARNAGELLATLIDLTRAVEPTFTAAGDEMDAALEELLEDPPDES